MDSPRSDSSAPPAADLHAWFSEEVQPHDAQLKAYLRSAVPAVRDVDDVVQDSYVRLLTARTAEPIRSAKAFLFRVARHLAVDALRGNRALLVSLEAAPAELLIDDAAQTAQTGSGNMSS